MHRNRQPVNPDSEHGQPEGRHIDMTSFTLPQATDQTGPPAGIYVFKLKGIERGIQGAAEYGGGERCKWIFGIEQAIAPDDPDEVEGYIGEEFWSFTSYPHKLGPKTKMRQYVEALLGRPLDEGEEPDGDDLIDRKVKVTLAPNDNKRNVIVSIMPHKGKRAPVVEPEDEEDY